jgi:hypothetical protein
MRPTHGQNLVMRFSPKYLAIGQKLNKTVIVLEERSVSTDPFEIFLLSPDPTYMDKISLQKRFIS